MKKVFNETKNRAVRPPSACKEDKGRLEHVRKGCKEDRPEKRRSGSRKAEEKGAGLKRLKRRNETEDKEFEVQAQKALEAKQAEEQKAFEEERNRLSEKELARLKEEHELVFKRREELHFLSQPVIAARQARRLAVESD
jgi:hypothetical protein